MTGFSIKFSKLGETQIREARPLDRVDESPDRSRLWEHIESKGALPASAHDRVKVWAARVRRIDERTHLPLRRPVHCTVKSRRGHI
jgi:hypothetical protein